MHITYYINVLRSITMSVSESEWSKKRSRVETQILELISKKIDNGTFNDDALIFDDEMSLSDFKKAIVRCVNLQAPCASKTHISMYCGDKISEYTDGQLSHPWTLLTYAVYYSNYDKAKILLEAGADIHFRRDKCDIPAYCYMGGFWTSDICMIDLCLSFGADINYSNDGYSILRKCGHTSSFEFFKALINKGANINPANCRLPIYGCISTSSSIEDNIMKFEYLIERQPELKSDLFDCINNMEFMSQDNKNKFLSKI